jgi:Lipocalin-like domain
MTKTMMWSVLLVSTMLAGRPTAQSTDDVARQLSGMWRLVANPQRLADGTTRQGTTGVIGYAFFDAAGRHMCFLTMNPNRPVWKGSAPTPEEGLAALRGISAYCATLEIHATEGFMDRRYEINQSPNAVGRTTRRWYSFQDADRMTLRVDPAELTAPVVETLFVWERVKD